MIGPGARIAIEPHRPQAGAHRAVDIGDRIIPDVQHICGPHTCLRQHAPEDPHIRLRCPGASRRDMPFEEVRKPTAFKVRVAVAQGKKAVFGREALKRRTYVWIQINPIARGEEHFQRVISMRHIVSRGTELPCERFAAQECQVVCLRRKLRSDGRTQRTHALHAVPLGHRRMGTLQPGIQFPLRGLDDRANRPQGVIEIKTEDLHLGIDRAPGGRIALAQVDDPL